MNNKAIREDGDGAPRAHPDRRLRADARRNADALLKAAKTVFATTGVNAPMRKIADKAGVGIGTVYRRFPARADLIVAVFRSEIDDCADAARVIAAKYRPFDALSRWIQRYLDLIMLKRGLAEALHSNESAYESLPKYFYERLVPPLQGLLEAAAGDIRADISAAELLRAVALLCVPATAGDFARTRHLVALLINGLRVPVRSFARAKRKAGAG